ncbi:MAG: dihydrodipicolinate reductase, partial [Myxococcota bacterium]|nr:dihydrodipicolinate reductase [Myxococcota bacterium]
MTLRVVQWNTGVVGSAGIRAIQAHPDLELVGCHAWSPEKVGRDVGTLCGMEPLGITATADVESLLELEPDCVLYTPQFPDIDLMVRLLTAGINIVSTAPFITGGKYGHGNIDRLDAAARQSGASLYGTGVNPGFANIFALISAGVCQRVDRISVLESVDSTHYG